MSGAITLRDVTLTGGSQGAVSSAGPVTLERVTARGQTAGTTATISSGHPFTMVDSAVVDNEAPGVVVTGSARIERSTIAHNSSGHAQLWALEGSTVRWSTLSGAPGHAALFAPGAEIEASVVQIPGGPSCETTVTSLGWNVFGDQSCGPPHSDDVVAPAHLLAPGEYGGPTPTQPSAAGSPVLDAVPVGAAGCGTTQVVDQRGSARPLGVACDAGAMEAPAVPVGPLALVVDSATDDTDEMAGDGVCATAAGVCSLRAAVQEANTWLTTDRITIAAGVHPTLTLGGAGEDGARTGDLDLVGEVLIDGSGATIDGDGLDGIFHVRSGHVVIQDLTVAGGAGSALGIGIRVESDLILQRATLSGIHGTGSALALTGDGAQLWIEDSTIEANTSTNGWVSSAVVVSGPAASLVIDDTDIVSNTGGGIAVLGAGATLVMAGSTVSGNDGPGVETLGPAILTETRIADNAGFGVDASADLTLTETEVAANTGAGVVARNGQLQVRRSTMADNGSTVGVQVLGGSALIVTSTLTGNEGPQLAVAPDATAQVRWSTLVAPDGGLAVEADSRTDVYLAADVLQARMGTVCSGLGRWHSEGWNVASDTSCPLAGPGDTVAAVPVSPLGDHGGPTATRPAYAGAVSLDAIPYGAAGCGTTYYKDQRNAVRPLAGGCDTGAVEAPGLVMPPPLNLVVDDPADTADISPGDGVCSDGAGRCTLRAAIDETNGWVGTDTITIAAGVAPMLVPGTLAENLNRTGDLDVFDGLNLVGNGATIDAAGSDGVLSLHLGDSLLTDVVMRGASSAGAGFTNAGTVLLDGVSVTNNLGDGIERTGTLTGVGVSVQRNGSLPTSNLMYQVENHGLLRLEDSTVGKSTSPVNNVALDNHAEATLVRTDLIDVPNFGIANSPGAVLRVEDSTIRGNWKGISNAGSVLLVRVDVSESRESALVNSGAQATLEMTDSTVRWSGGALENRHGAVATLRRSTVSGNSRYDHAGQIVNDATLELHWSTVVGFGEPAMAGSGPVTVEATVLSTWDGPACAGTGPIAATWSAASDSTCGPAGPDWLVGDLRLGPLADNGGLTETHPPFGDSVLLDAVPAGAAGCGGTEVADQRQVPRPSGAGCDIGSVEGAGVIPAGPLHLVVTSAAEGVDATPGDGLCRTVFGNCTLRAAIMEANGWPGADTITIAPGTHPTIGKWGRGEEAGRAGDLDVWGDLTLHGGGAIIDGSLLDGIFDVHAGTLSVDEVHLVRSLDRALQVAGVAAASLVDSEVSDSQGLAVVSGGDLVMQRSVLSGLGSTGGVGALALGGTAVIEDVTIEDYTSTGVGQRSIIGVGGAAELRRLQVVGNAAAAKSIIEVYSGGTLSLESSTLTANTSSSLITNAGTADVWQSSLVDNTTTSQAVVSSGPLSLHWSTIAGNLSTGPALFTGLYRPLLEASVITHPGGACRYTADVASSYNVVADSSCGLSGAGNLQGSDPLLDTLTTAPPYVRALLAGSPARDRIPAGTLGCGATLTGDQVGNPRPQGPACDAGAVETP